jgi:hypothetical protein
MIRLKKIRKSGRPKFSLEEQAKRYYPPKKS